MPKVSIIVPIYGVEKYIEQCARSLFEQTLNDMEFIFIDDCTQDRSVEILCQLLEEYRDHIDNMNWGVRLEKMPVNSGLAAVRKYGLQLAQGDYIVHCDSDDWVDSMMYEKLYNFAMREKYDLVFCDYVISGSSSNVVFHKNINTKQKNDLIRRLLVSTDLNPVWSAIVHRDVYKRIIPPTGDQTEDKTFMIQLCYYSDKIGYCPEALYFYRVTPNSMSRKNGVDALICKYDQVKSNREIIYSFAKEEELLETYKKEFQVFFVKTKYLLADGLQDGRCKKLWKSSFPSFNRHIYMNPYLSFREKLWLIKQNLRSQ